MMRVLTLCLVLCLPEAARAQSQQAIVEEAVENHILPAYHALAREAAELANVMQTACRPDDPALQEAFGQAFDAWIRVSHIGFGPVETNGRYFALSFWPDTRGMTGRSLSRLMAEQDSAIESPTEFQEVSVAARGFYALEYLLFDPELSNGAQDIYRCALSEAIARDIATTAAAIHSDWVGSFAGLMRDAGSNDRFQSPGEAVRVLFGAFVTGLEFTSDLRLGRPLGTFDAPRPTRAEARRSGRSLRHVELSLRSLAELGHILSQGDPELQQRISDQFAVALDRVNALDDPIFAGVSDPQARLRIEVLQQRVRDIRSVAIAELGPAIGVAAGFNSLDGD